MSRDSRELFGPALLGAVALCGVTAIAISDRASAQYYCDERYQDCYRRSPPPPLPFPFGLFQPREVAPPPPPQPEPRQMPARPEYTRPERTERPVDPAIARQYAGLYAPVNGEPYAVPAVRLSDIDPQFLRKRVNVQTDEAPGTIIINTQNRFLYFVEGGGQAIRYGVGVGRQGFGWSGIANVKNKQEWPDWYPPKEMIARQAELRRQLSELQSGLGMRGGPHNPLGARAMYLWQGNKDTLYRIHGTSEPWTIGQNVSSGCIRMINQDVIDLYERVSLGAKVVVLPARS